MDKIEERAKKILTEKGVKNREKIEFYSAILADFAIEECQKAGFDFIEKLNCESAEEALRLLEMSRQILFLHNKSLESGKPMYCKVGRFQDDSNSSILWISHGDTTPINRVVELAEELRIAKDKTKQEREAVRAEIAELMTELDNISATREIYFDKLLKIKFEHVKKRLKDVLKSLKGGE